jgi:uncharacterized membrane protein YcaP (DUF421 family)
VSKLHLTTYIVLFIVGALCISKIPNDQLYPVSLMALFGFMITCIKCDIAERENIKLRKRLEDKPNE